MKVDRLFGIVHILLNKKHVTAKELAAEFEVSARTIYRDIDILARNNIPIYTDKGCGGGISLLDHYILNKSVISDEEKNSIIMGLEILKTTEYDDVNNVLEKLKHLLDRGNNNYIEVDFSRWGTDEKQKKMFDGIKEAINNSCVVEIDYKNNEGERTKRKIVPLKLIFKVQRWYLIAYCNLKKDYRMFRISRLKNLKLIDEKFDRTMYDISNENFNVYETKYDIKVVLMLTKVAFYRVEEEFKADMIEYENDILVVTFNTRNDDYLHNYIMSFGEYLIDIKPKELKDIIKEKASNISKILA